MFDAFLELHYKFYQTQRHEQLRIPHPFATRFRATRMCKAYY